MLNGDGGVDVTGAPGSILVEGANNALWPDPQELACQCIVQVAE